MRMGAHMACASEITASWKGSRPLDHLIIHKLAVPSAEAGRHAHAGSGNQPLSKCCRSQQPTSGAAAAAAAAAAAVLLQSVEQPPPQHELVTFGATTSCEFCQGPVPTLTSHARPPPGHLPNTTALLWSKHDKHKPQLLYIRPRAVYPLQKAVRFCYDPPHPCIQHTFDPTTHTTRCRGHQPRSAPNAAITPQAPPMMPRAVLYFY